MARNDSFRVGASPVPEIAAGARRYSQIAGLHVPQREFYGNVAITQPATSRIAEAYDRLPEFDRNAIPAYKAMREETGRQYDFMTRPRSKGGMGIDIEVTHDDPYGQNSVHDIVNELRSDIQNKGKIQVFSTKATGGHPFFTDDENDMFRGVHDVFGHLGSGRGIDAHGEDAAYQKHSRMFSPLARGALATETRGQNAALHKHGEFQEQKVALLPPHMQTAQFGSLGNVVDRLNAAQDARNENLKQGL